MGRLGFGKGGPKMGVWGRSQTPTDFYGFHIKNTHFSTLFLEKDTPVPATIVQSL